MKKGIYIVLLSLALGACNSWLDVKPDLEVYEETMFEKSGGYYTALNGLYILMSEGTLYGQNLSFGAMEAWGHSYVLDEDAHETFYDLANFKYDNDGPVTLAENIWLRCYKIIAEANNLIQNLEEDTDVVFKYGDTTRKRVLGEAYAIRSLMHFEIVRIFAKAPIVDDGSSSIVPWVTEYPSRLNPPIPTKEVLANIITDLERARLLVKAFDTNGDYPGSLSYIDTYVDRRLKLEVPGSTTISFEDDDFFQYRADRLNYYAITQLLARVCLYAGDNDKAFEYANEIVELVRTKKVYMFTPLSYIANPISTVGTVHPRLHEEIIFGTYNSKLVDLTDSYFGEKTASSSKLRISDPNDLFDNPNDCRLQTIVDRMPTKFSSVGANEDNMLRASTTVPVLRFPEAYYIAAESIFEKDKMKAVELFNECVTERGNEVYKLSSEVDKQTFMDAIVEEYRREFLCEGQLVFVYKRLNIPIRDESGNVEHGGLVLPVPDIEAGIQ